MLFVASKYFSPVGVENSTTNVMNLLTPSPFCLKTFLYKPYYPSTGAAAFLFLHPSYITPALAVAVKLSLRFMHSALYCLNILRSEALIPHSYDCDNWTYRTGGERYYLDNLVTMSLRRVAEESDRLWRDKLTVDHEAMFWNRAILPENFRHAKSSTIPFFQQTVRFGRRLSSDTGYFLAYQLI